MLRLFCLGFPKTGTCTIQAALESAGLSVAHSNCAEGRVGVLLYQAHSEGRDPMHYLPYEAIVHPSVCVPRKGLNHWPQMDKPLLQSLRRHHPRAVFCLNKREPKNLVRSIRNWRDQMERYRGADIPGLPAGRGHKREISRWIKWHYDRMRKLFDGDPRFIEIDIEDGDGSRRALQSALGITIEEWPWLNRNVS